MNEDLPARIRHAVASGLFAQAGDLWNEYAGEYADELRAGTAPPSRHADMHELVEWCRVATLAARAHAQDRWNALAASEKYLQPAPGGLSRIATSF